VKVYREDGQWYAEAGGFYDNRQGEYGPPQVRGPHAAPPKPQVTVDVPHDPLHEAGHQQTVYTVHGRPEFILSERGSAERGWETLEDVPLEMYETAHRAAVEAAAKIWATADADRREAQTAYRDAMVAAGQVWDAEVQAATRRVEKATLAAEAKVAEAAAATTATWSAWVKARAEARGEEVNA